jgi:2-isopropylmalate synthase
MQKNKVLFFDTTLRDGEQSPGATMTHSEKMQVALQLEKLGVDIIEAGFPIASNDDFNAVKQIAETLQKPVIAGLSRAVEKDILRAWEAIQNAKHPRIHTFMSSSDIHLKEQFKISRKEALEMSVKAVKLAKSLCENVEFSAMDASRTEPEFLFEVIEAAISVGATTINIPDTVGYSQPAEFGALIKSITEKVPNIGQAIISVHCHNDLGLAVANSLEALRNGARQVECTINGIGERAGNASLEEIAMSLFTRKQFFGLESNINLSEIFPSSQLVSRVTGISVQRNKAIVGENAFSHEAGIHQHGLLANAQTYEIMNPELIGKKSRLVLGKHSGKHATFSVLQQMGFSLTEEQLSQVTARIKQLADKQKIVLEEDLAAIACDVTKQLRKEEQRIVLSDLKIETGNNIKPKAKLELLIDGKKVFAVANGVGPVDALANALKSVVPEKISLEEYHLKAITGGTDALADVVVKVSSNNGTLIDAEAINEDVVMASANALVKAFNKALAKKQEREKK